MKTPETLKWAVLAGMAIFFACLGKINYQHRFTGLFALIVLGAVAAMLFLFYFLGESGFGMMDGPPQKGGIPDKSND